MGDANVHARRVLLRCYEAAVMALEDASSLPEVYVLGGRLAALAGVLRECRHQSNGWPVIRPHEWERDATERMIAALRRLGYSIGPDHARHVQEVMTYGKENGTTGSSRAAGSAERGARVLPSRRAGDRVPAHVQHRGSPIEGF